jgi:hypothetical protein
MEKQTAIEAVKIITAIGDAIRDSKEIPSGTLYAVLCGRMSITAYSNIINILKRAGLVEEKSNLLRWIGPSQFTRANGLETTFQK